MFRNPKPDEATKEDVLKKLKENNLDESNLMEFSADHCQQLE
jgi:hypothetical protein